MNSASSRCAFTLVIASSLLLAGCTPTGSSGPSQGGDSGGAPASGSAANCGAYEGQTDPELMLFTSSAIDAGPTQGQKYGDGTTLSVTLSQEAIAAGLLPQFEINTISSSGGPELVSSLIFDPTTGGDGTYSTSSLEFGHDDLVGTAVVAEIFAISDAKILEAQRILFGPQGAQCV